MSQSFIATNVPSSCFPWWETPISSELRVRDILNVEGDGDPLEGPRKRISRRLPVWLRLLRPVEGGSPDSDALACTALRELMYWALRDPSGEWTRWHRSEIPLRTEGPGKHHVEHLWDTKPLVHDWLRVAWNGMQRYHEGHVKWESLVETLTELAAFLSAGPTAVQASVPESVNQKVAKIVRKGSGVEGFEKYPAVGIEYPVWEGADIEPALFARKVQDVINEARRSHFSAACERLGVSSSSDYPRQVSVVTDDEAAGRLQSVIDEGADFGVNLKRSGGLYLVYRSVRDRLSADNHSRNPYKRPQGDGPIAPVTCGLKSSSSITVEARIASNGGRCIPFYQWEADEMVRSLEPAMQAHAQKKGWFYQRGKGGKTQVNLKLQWVLPSTASPTDIAQAHRDLDKIMRACGWV